MAFVTLQQVKDHLRLTSSDADADLTLKMAQAEAQVLEWCSKSTRTRTIAEAWDAATVPLVVIAAILIQTGELDRFRGDDSDSPPRTNGEDLNVNVRELLRAYHDPVIA